MPDIFLKALLFAVVSMSLCVWSGFGQESEKAPPVAPGSDIEIINLRGKITVKSHDDESIRDLTFNAASPDNSPFEIKTGESKSNSQRFEIVSSSRVDIVVSAPRDISFKLKTEDGQITIDGSFLHVEAETNTGTIYAETDAFNLDYKFLWTASFPRFVSEVKLADIEEKAAGKHVIEGRLAASSAGSESISQPRREIYLRTRRGIILFNVPPSQVPNDLLPKKMTVAARTVLESGDARLASAIRRAAPELFKDYSAITGPARSQPVLVESNRRETLVSELKKITVQVTDIDNRALSGLRDADFKISERGEAREVVSVQQSSTQFNLLLLIDVSGSVENHVDFIRKAARAFVNTVESKDRISIIIFNEDVNKLSGFTSDKESLSEALDTFDAGGGTALYDAIAFGLVDSIEPLRGERSAVVILSDGDDNKSFLAFDTLIGSIEESGALIYPLYVPSSLIASSGNYEADTAADPLRDRYLTRNLSSRARDEGEKLAKISGGVYYPISRLTQLQQAYNDIVLQLRTSYTITFKSGLTEEIGNRASPRLKVSVLKEGAFIKLGPVTSAVDK